MPKAKQEAAKSKAQVETTKKAARTKPSAGAKRTVATKKALAAKRAVAPKAAPKTTATASRTRTKPAAKKPKAVAKKTVATRAAKSKTTVRATAGRTPTVKTKAVAAKQARSSARRRSLVVDVSPAVIDTSLAAEVAAALVRQGQAKAETLAQSTTPLPAPEVVKRGSSALRHVKENLANPISRQLDSVFGPLMTPQVSAFLSSKARRAERSRPAGKKFDPHAGHFGVPRRAAG